MLNLTQQPPTQEMLALKDEFETELNKRSLPRRLLYLNSNTAVVKDEFITPTFSVCCDVKEIPCHITNFMSKEEVIKIELKNSAILVAEIEEQSFINTLIATSLMFENISIVENIENNNIINAKNNIEKSYLNIKTFIGLPKTFYDRIQYCDVGLEKLSLFGVDFHPTNFKTKLKPFNDNEFLIALGDIKQNEANRNSQIRYTSKISIDDHFGRIRIKSEMKYYINPLCIETIISNKIK